MTTTETRTPTATDLAATILPAVDRLLADLDGSVLVSQNRWVDHLLDLYNATPHIDLRREIGRILSEIRHLSSVQAAALRSRLLMLVGAVTVESAFDALLLSPRSAAS